MTSTYRGFLKEDKDGLFKVVAGKIAPESLLATECLAHKLYQLRELVRGRVLDVGCSTKPYQPLFDHNVTQYVGADVPFAGHANPVIDVFSRAEYLPFQGESFDTVLLTEVLEHVPDPGSALQEVARVLVPEGKAIVSVPFMYRVHEAPYDFYRYTPFSMKHLAEAAGLRVSEVKTRGGYFTVFADLSNKGNTLLFGALRRALRLSHDSSGAKVLMAIQRAVLTPIQKAQWLLLRNEGVASERYTLGYVFVLEKVPLDSSTAKSDGR